MTEEKITIIHTNDLHSHVFRLPKIKRWIENRVTELLEQGHFVIVVDDGDFIDRSDDNTQATWGRDNTKFMDEMPYYFATIGNNEGLALPHERLNELYENRGFVVLLSNIKDLKGQTPKWAVDDASIVSYQGTRIMLTGMTANYSTYPLLGWMPLDPMAKIQEYNKRKDEYDLFIFLSHLGYPTDKAIADRNENIDVIIGSHTHHLLEVGEKRNHSLLTAAGRYGEYIGEITLTLENHKIINKAARTIEVDRLADDASDIVWTNDWHNGGKAALSKRVIVDLPEPRNAYQQTQDFLTILKEYLNTEISMVSTGMFLKTLENGPLTELDLLEDLPHSIDLMKVTLHGIDLKKFLKEVDSQSSYLRNTHINGSGFRGDKFGELVFDGLNRKNIKDNELYTIGTIDHYLFLPYFRTLENYGEVEFDYSLIMRELAAIYYKEKYE
ncbi:MAG: metallophosphoesterase [Lactobacillaceae bacterium]|jgi:2',3'-cyclic-nucleotide 2'-phosphodiesterase (5'-nucleotidase family)|nr:metallophosphoesterase [Lactobacillaceae bacterium]